MEIKIDNENVFLCNKDGKLLEFCGGGVDHISFDNCDNIGLSHAWENVKQDFVCLSDPPHFPRPKRRCLNCGKTQTLTTIQLEEKEWQDN